MPKTTKKTSTVKKKEDVELKKTEKKPLKRQAELLVLKISSV